MAATADSLAADWLIQISRRLDHLEAVQSQSAQQKERIETELAAAQNGHKRTGSGSTIGDSVELPSSISEPKSVPTCKELLQALDSLKGRSSSLTASADSGDAIHYARLTYAVYALALQHLFDEAERFQDATWYWSSVEESYWTAASYLLQTLPSRLVLLSKEGYRILKETTRSANLSGTVSPKIDRQAVQATLRRLRSTPELAIGALWPHSIESQTDLAGLSSTQNSRKALAGPLVLMRKAQRLSPINLTLHEARIKRYHLQRQRQELAAQLGGLAVTALSGGRDTEPTTIEEAQSETDRLATDLQRVFVPSSRSIPAAATLDERLRLILSSPAFQTGVVDYAPVGYSPPSRLAQIWPRLVLYPTIALVGLRYASQNRDMIRQALEDGRETIKGFFTNWVINPVKDLIDTIRGGDVREADGIVTKEGRAADLESLERMVTTYAIEKGQISASDAERAEALRLKVREGNLDVVMRAYEDQLKSPFKSLTMGSLPRLLLIQVQKAKYDLAVAMSGIDHLLKSQALLFGAVGIAPAMGILWGSFKGMKWIFGARGVKETGRERERAWSAMRRIDRLLTRNTRENEGSATDAQGLSDEQYGLLLLELATLRRVAGKALSLSGEAGSPSSKGASRKKRLTLSKGLRRRLDERLSDFLEDVRDLEGIAVQSSPQGSQSLRSSSNVGKETVERMWRCWGWLFSVPAL